MSAITLSDIKPIPVYETQREVTRARIIAIKKLRRVEIGDKVTLTFENRNTVLFQIQEMLRVERITREEAIREEIEAYAPLVPGPGQLSATLFINITREDNLRAEIDRFIGINEHVHLRIGDRYTIPGEFEPGYSREDRVAAVQYVKFSFTPEQAEAFKAGRNPVTIEIDHPNYHATAAMDAAVRQALASDLAWRGAAPNLEPGGAD